MPSILPHITLDTGPTPTYSIIWLHGLGADGGDFVPIAKELILPAPVRYIFPHAPLRPVTINNGYVMPAWYDILPLAAAGGISVGSGRQEDAAGIRATQAEIEKLIAQEKERGIPATNIFLAGFSQGGAVALHTGLRHAERLGGILALSTYLPLSQTLPAEASAAAAHAPIFMGHGHGDPVVPYALGHAAAEQLLALGYQLAWHSYAMQHSVCPEEIYDIQLWLTQQMRG